MDGTDRTYGDRGFEFESEVTHDLVVSYAAEIIHLIDNEKLLKSGKLIIPTEAHGFLDKDGVLAWEKLKKVVDMMRLMSGTDRASLNKAISEIGYVSSDTAQIVALISRVWKYFEMGKADGSHAGQQMEPGEVHMLLEDQLREEGFTLPSFDEERLITRSLDRWKKGDDTKLILADTQQQIRDVFSGAKSEKQEISAKRIERMTRIYTFLADKMKGSVNAK